MLRITVHNKLPVNYVPARRQAITPVAARVGQMLEAHADEQGQASRPRRPDRVNVRG